jgi:hypothetical protein
MKNHAQVALSKSFNQRKEAAGTLERKIISAKSSQSKYRIGDKIITVNSCFTGPKSMGDALFEIARYRMESKQTAQTGLRLN